MLEMAERDLEATLQLLAERAHYITGASGAAIGLAQNGEVICRASAGPSAPPIGTRLSVSSGLSGESVRTRQILTCDDASKDPRVNQSSCQSLGIASAIVTPLRQDEEVVGVFELLSGKPAAFAEPDVLAIERLGHMIETALDHARAAWRAQGHVDGPNPPIALDYVEVQFVAAANLAQQGNPETDLPETAALTLGTTHPRVGSCASCGFPISEKRKFCLDCEARAQESGSPSVESASNLAQQCSKWAMSPKYIIGALLAVGAAAGAVLLWLR